MTRDARGADAPERITLLCDYVDFPLWGRFGPIGENELPLTGSTKSRVRAWLKAWDPDFDTEGRASWPEWNPPEGTEEDYSTAWRAEAESIRDLIQTELGRVYRVDIQY